MRFRAVWIVLVPAIAVAAPRHHRHRHGRPAHPAHHHASHHPAEPAAATPEPPAAPAEGSAAEAGSAAAAPDAGATPPAPAPAPDPAAATPAAAPAPAAPEPAAASAPDVDELRQQYLKLRDELFESRARANAVASQLYSTRITIRFTWASGRYYGVTKAQVRLDGATVYQDTTGAISNDDGVRFDGFVAPGRHLVTFHVEATGKDDDTFTSSTETQVVVKAVAHKDLVVAARAHDDGDISYAWKRGEHGRYALGVDVAVTTKARAEAKGKK